jgi:hypothetical protein
MAKKKVDEDGLGGLRLEAFLKAAPDPSDWEYEGPGSGGYVLRWTGSNALLKEGEYTVRFHVHGRDGSGWIFGGAWIEGTDVRFRINDRLRYSVKPVADVADRFKSDILDDVQKEKDGKSRK